MPSLITTYPQVPFSTNCRLFENVFVGPNRAIFNADWSFNSEASQLFLCWDANLKGKRHADNGLSFDDRIQQLRTEAQQSCKTELRASDFPYVLCTHYYKGYPFGHWFETLGSLQHVPEKAVAIHGDYGGVVGTREIPQHLKIVGFDSVHVKTKCTAFVDKLYVTSLDASAGSISQANIDWLRQKYWGYFAEELKSAKETKLYLSRNYFTHPNPVWTRRVVNEETEVMPFLQQQGYLLLKGTEDILAMLLWFYRAREIVFPHGAMMYWSIFSVDNPKGLEFVSEHRPCNLFVELGEKVTSYPFRQVKASANATTNDLVIDMNVLKEFVNAD